MSLGISPSCFPKLKSGQVGLSRQLAADDNFFPTVAYLKLRKHFYRKLLFRRCRSSDYAREMILSSDNSGMIVVKCSRLFNHLLISITGAQRSFMTTRKQWNQLSANFKDAAHKTWQRLARHAPLHPWKVKFLSINGLLTIKRQRRENNRHNGHESVQEINTLVELLHWKWFVTKFLKNPVSIFEIDDMLVVVLRFSICILEYKP